MLPEDARALSEVIQLHISRSTHQIGVCRARLPVGARGCHGPLYKMCLRDCERGEGMCKYHEKTPSVLDESNASSTIQVDDRRLEQLVLLEGALTGS